MRAKLSIITSLALAAAGLVGAGCRKAQPAVRLDPHSPEAVLVRLVEQGTLLNDAVGRSDFKYVHDYSYYFNGLAQTFYAKLTDPQKDQFRNSFQELSILTDQLDHASGRQHSEATQATMTKVLAVLKEMGKRFQQMKQNPAG